MILGGIARTFGSHRAQRSRLARLRDSPSTRFARAGSGRRARCDRLKQFSNPALPPFSSTLDATTLAHRANPKLQYRTPTIPVSVRHFLQLSEGS